MREAPAADRILRILAYEKAVFIAILLLGHIIGNLLTRPELNQLLSSPVPVAHLLVGAVAVSALAALVLYIDWGLIKRWMIYVIVILCFSQAYGIYSLADGQHTRLVVKFSFDGVLLLWCMWLLFRDLRNYE